MLVHQHQLFYIGYMNEPKISFIDFLKYVRIYNKETGELINFKIKDVENKLKILKNGRKKHRRI